MKRGRKRKYGATDFTRTKCWALLVKDVSDLPTFTDVERRLLPHTFSKKNDTDVGGWSSSCAFNHYFSGIKVACPKHIDLAEAAYKGKGTRDFYYHPFWDLIKFSSNNIEELYLSLARLRPGISNLLFYNSNIGERPHRRPLTEVNETLDKLDKESDFDALTACIGLLIEAKLFSNGVHCIFTSITIPLIIHRVFKRVASSFPFYNVADDLYADIHDNHLRKNDTEDGKEYYDLLNVQQRIDDNRRILKYIKDNHVLRYHNAVPLTCLHLSEPYITNALIYELRRQKTSEELFKIRQSLGIRNMTRCIRRWENKLIAN